MKHIHVILIFFIPLFFACNQPQNPLTTFAGKNDTTLLAETFGICSDAEGNLYAADVRNHCISKVNELGEVSIYAGTKEEGSNDGVLNVASFTSPSGVCFDKNENMFVAGFGGNNIRKITPDGMVTTFAGTGEEGYVDGLADSAKFSSPRGVCVDSKGNVFVADCWNHRIRKVSPDGMVTTFAGGGKIGVLVENAWRDGADTTARFDAPCGLSIDKNDNIYVADANNSCIRKITPDGYVTTLAGIGKQKGLLDGSKDTALLNVPTEVFVADDLTVYFSDTYNHCVRKVDADGIVTTLVGTGEKGFTEAEPLNSLLSSPRRICVYDEYLYFAEWGNHTIRKLKL
jgi:sugar lactone lactonase YvrE